jgi:hypothetical protein
VILRNKKYRHNDDKRERGKHGEVFFVLKSPTAVEKPRSRFAIKKQPIRSPRNLADRSYREFFILRQLNKLKLKSNHYINEEDFGFVGLVDWFKGKEDLQYMHFVLECADMTLNEYKSLTLYEYKSIFFQILFALYVSQKEYQFVHNDLHLKNILLKAPNQANTLSTFKDDDSTWYTIGHIVKISDFGLSRIRTDKNEVVHNYDFPLTYHFTADTDVNKVVEEFTKVKIKPESWVTDEDRKAGKNLTDIENIKKNQLRELRKKLKRNLPLKDALRNPFFDELKHKPINVDEKKEVTAPIETIKVKLDFENLGGEGVGRISPIKSIRAENKENSLNNVEKAISSPTKSVPRTPLADVTNKKATKKTAKPKNSRAKFTESVIEVKNIDIMPKEEADLADRLLSKLVNVLKSSPKKSKPAPARTSSVKNIFAALGKDEKKDKKDDDKKEDPNPSKKSSKKAKEPKKEKESRKRKREDDEVVEEVRCSKRLKLKQETVQISLVEEKPKETKVSKKKDKEQKVKKDKVAKEAKKSEKSTSTKKRKRDAAEETDERPVKKAKSDERPSRTRVQLEKFMVGASEKKKSKK